MTIVFGIIKVILIIILILLALLLILTGLILFAPIRYRIKGSFHDELACGTAEAKWLFGVLGFRASAGKDEKASAYISICGFKIQDLLEDEGEESTVGESPAEAFRNDKTSQADVTADTKNTVSFESKAAASTSGIRSDTGEDGLILVPVSDDKEADPRTSAVAGQIKQLSDSEQKDGSEVKSKARITVYSTHKLRDKLESLEDAAERFINSIKDKTKARLGRIKGFPQRLADRISTVIDGLEAKLKELLKSAAEVFKKLKAAYDKRSGQLRQLKELWQDERFAQGRELLISRILKLLKELKPRRGKGYLRLGFDDPYTTGQAMMLASVLYPLYAEHIEMIPDFDKEIIDGELDIRGRIRVIVPAEAALRIFFNKQLRAMYKKARRILELDA